MAKINTTTEDSIESTEPTTDTYKEPSAAQIAAWKKKHESENIHVFEVFDERDKSIKKAYFREPNIIDMQRASQSNKAKEGTFNQSLFENCWLDGHPDIKLVNKLLLGVIQNVGELNVAAEVQVKKL